MVTLALASLVLFSQPEPAKVTELRQGPSGWELLHEGKPYVVKGAGAPLDLLDELKAAGANTVRTWGVGDDTSAFLDRAQEVGLKVVLGIWIRKDPDFSYDRLEDRQSQYKHAAEAVAKHKNHPALLMWAVGNETELGTPQDKIWHEVEHIARIVKRGDPTRPVMTVVADMWEEKMKAILSTCPSIDLLGVNSYDGLTTLESRMTPWTKPYLVTEYAFSIAGGQTKTPFGLVIEPSSTEKARSTRTNHDRHVFGLPGRSLGGFFFYWGKSGSQTASMHSSFLKTGEKLGVVDELTEAWSGKRPENEAPLLEKATPLDGFGLTWEVDFRDPDGDSLDLTLEIIREDPQGRFVGDHEMAQPVVSRTAIGPRFQMPTGLEKGLYRAVVIARDGEGGAAVWNHPFQKL